MNKWYMHNPAAVQENVTHKLLWDYDIQTDHVFSASWPHLIVINIKKRACKIVDFSVSADHRIKRKESVKKDNYLELAGELKKKTMEQEGEFIPIMIGTFGTATKGLLKGLEDSEIWGRVETIQTITLLRMVRIRKRVLRLETGYHSNSSERPSAYSKCRLCGDRDETINHIQSHIQTHLGRWHTNGSRYLGQKTWL